MAKAKDLSGKRFGKVLVIERNFASQKGGHAMWDCVCDCGNTFVARSNNLLNGHTTSCGFCAGKGGNNRKGRLSSESKKIKGNNCEVIGDVAYVKMSNCDDVMMCDKEDWEIAKKFTWHKNDKGYAAHGINGTKEKFHQLIITTDSYEMVDHINGNKLDNRRTNLRIVNKSENCFNCKRKTSISGKTGVRRLKNGKWIASIIKNKIFYNLGTYEELDRAIEVRKDAEIRFFGIHCRS